MKRLVLLLITVGTITSEPAFGCHLYSHWAYPFRQRCPVHAARYVARVPPPPHRPPTLLEKIDVTIPLPGLNNIDWGRPADEQTIGRVLLRAKLLGVQ
jgi:hypothetical protein